MINQGDIVRDSDNYLWTVIDRSDSLLVCESLDGQDRIMLDPEDVIIYQPQGTYYDRGDRLR
jgi:hypothetical protein